MSSKQPAVEPSSKGRSQPENALMQAIMEKNVNKVASCLETGINPDFMWAERKDLTPLITACRLNSPEIVDLLLRHNADPNFANVHGFPPLHATIARPELEKIFSEATGGGKHLNVEACRMVFKTNVVLLNDLKIVHALLDAGADINRADLQDRTPVFLAGQYLRLDILLELFKLHADQHLPKGTSLGDRALFALGFGRMKAQLKKNQNATLDDMLNYVKQYEDLVQKVLGGEGEVAELEQAIEKDDKALEHYIHALKKVVDEYLSKKTTFAPGKAKHEGAKVFLERLKLLDTMDEAKELAIPFSEVFTDKKLAQAAAEMLKNLPKFVDQKNLQNVMITLDDLLSLNRQANKKEEPESLKRFRAAFQKLEEEEAKASKGAGKK